MNPQDPSPYLFMGKMQRSDATASREVVEKLRRFVTLRPDSAEANYFYAIALSKTRKGGTHDVPVSEIES